IPILYGPSSHLYAAQTSISGWISAILKGRAPTDCVPSTINNADSIVFENKIWTKVEQEAQFPGGDLGWRDFLVKNLNMSNIHDKIKFKRKEKVIQETVIVKFVVSSNGSLSNIEIENEVNPLFAKEALRVINLSPRWIPAYQNERKVNAYRRQPITFRIEKE
nr:energy transducer TonB [Ferruginibacter sp.]